MRTSLFSFFLLLALTTYSAFADSVDRQFEPKSYVKPPLHTMTPRPPSVTPKVSKSAIKPVPLEVQRVRAKMQKHPHLVITHRRKPHIVKHHSIKKKNRLYSANKRHHHLSTAVVYSGSLRSNIERIAREHGWSRVVWRLPEDYRWVGNTRISGHGIVGIFEKLLKSYPLQADFYMGNHVLVIVPRTLQ